MYMISRFRTILFLPFIVASGCTVGESVVPTAQLTLSVSHTGGPCKSQSRSYPGEDMVGSLSFYVFDGSGRLEACADPDGDGQVSVSISVGQKTIRALVNVPAEDYSGVLTLDEFDAVPITYQNVDPCHLPMEGTFSGIVGPGRADVSIEVERCVARIVLESVKNRLEGALEGEPMDVRRIFLINVAGSCKTGRAENPEPLWLNTGERKMDKEWAQCTVADIGLVLPCGEECRPDLPLYFFRNASSDPALYTRAVVEIWIKGERYYYPVNLLDSGRNRSYQLRLSVTHLGSLDPDSFTWAEIQPVVVDVDQFDEFDDIFEVIY